MLRPLSTLKLPERARTKLQTSGYKFVEDIEQVVPESEKSLTTFKALIKDHEIVEKLKFVNSTSKIISAVDLWHFELLHPPVAVFHRGLDKLLNGGLPIGRITELCGAPGIGKTQMCLQFCVDAQIPSELGGSGAQAFYVSTDFGFDVSRLQEIIRGSIDHCSNVNLSGKQDTKVFLESLTVESLLDGVSVAHVHDVSGLCNTIKSLANFLQSRSNVRLIIIDSFSLPFVVEIKDLALRSKIISNMLDILLDCAMKFNLAIVLTNQLVTIITKNKEAVLKPSLGEGFGHRVHQRLVLDDGKVYLTKTINGPQTFTYFEIVKEGIR